MDSREKFREDIKIKGRQAINNIHMSILSELNKDTISQNSRQDVKTMEEKSDDKEL